MTIEMVPKHQLPNFPSMANATWRDIRGNTNKKYSVRPVEGGFVIVDTENGADQKCSAVFADEASANEHLHTTQK